MSEKPRHPFIPEEQPSKEKVASQEIATAIAGRLLYERQLPPYRDETLNNPQAHEVFTRVKDSWAVSLAPVLRFPFPQADFFTKDTSVQHITDEGWQALNQVQGGSFSPDQTRRLATAIISSREGLSPIPPEETYLNFMRMFENAQILATELGVAVSQVYEDDALYHKLLSLSFTKETYEDESLTYMASFTLENEFLADARLSHYLEQIKVSEEYIDTYGFEPDNKKVKKIMKKNRKNKKNRKAKQKEIAKKQHAAMEIILKRIDKAWGS